MIRQKSTVILVTNALQYLSHPMVDRIVVLEHGVVVESGSYQELSDRKGSQFQKLLSAFTDTMSGDYGGNKDELEAEFGHDSEQSHLSGLGLNYSDRQSARKHDVEEEVDDKKQQKLMSDEMAEREIGKVGRDVYLTWASAAGGLWVIPFVLLIFTLGEAASILSNWWLTYWSHNADTSSSSQLYFLGIYGIINVSAIFAEFLRQVVVVLFGLQASKTVSAL
jgi:ATP-binding cassette subfamily C (CFTR/MRP) protein 1